MSSAFYILFALAVVLIVMLVGYGILKKKNKIQLLSNTQLLVVIILLTMSILATLIMHWIGIF